MDIKDRDRDYMDHKVSVIIPAFNSEDTLPGLLDLMLTQKHEDLEIIVINDGSTDGTQKVIDEYKAKDSRIVGIKQDNQGVGAARNAGLDIATGDFVCFFDSDDEVPTTSIKRLIRRMKTDDIDMVIGEAEVIDMGKSHVIKSTERLGETKHISRFRKSLNWSLSLWNKLFRRSVIEENHLRFNHSARGEDAVFVFSFIHCCNDIVGCPAVVYRYNKKPFWEGMSLSKAHTKESLLSVYDNYREIIRILDDSIASEKERLKGSSDDTDISVDEQLDNMMQCRSNLFRKFTSTLITKFYRCIWNAEDGVFDELKDMYSEYLAELSDEDREILYSQHADLELENGLMTKDELAEKPLITIAVSGKVPSDSLESLVLSYYNQIFQRFEMIADEKAAGRLTEEITSRSNFRTIKSGIGKAFKRTAIDDAKGEWIIFCDEDVIPATETILEMWEHMKDNDSAFVLSPVATIKGRKVSPERDDDRSVWGNKMFRLEDIKDSKVFGKMMDPGKPEKLYDLSHEEYQDGLFLKQCR